MAYAQLNPSLKMGSPNQIKQLGLGTTPVPSAQMRFVMPKPQPQQAVLDASTQYTAPTTQQQATQPTATAAGGGTGGALPATGGQPGTTDTSGGGGYDYLSALRNAFGQSRQALQDQIPTYDSDFQNFQNTTNQGVQRAQDTLTQQNSADDLTYGNSLKSLLQTDRELRQRSQGTFSANNALDSSAYNDSVNKLDQNLLNNTQSIDSEKNRVGADRKSQFAAFQDDANSKIASYGNEINRAKQGLQQAIANQDIQQASTIQNYIQQVSQQAQQLQAQRQAMALNLAQLQAQGVNVNANLQNTNLNQFANTFGSGLQSQLQNGISQLSGNQTQSQGQGYITGKSGKQYRSTQEAQQAGDL